MAEVDDADLTFGDLLRRARQCCRKNQPQAALDAAWAAFDLAPNDCRTTALVTELLRHYPANLQVDRQAAYLKLLTNRRVEPDLINPAGWWLLLRSYGLADDAGDVDFEIIIAEFEHNELVLALLQESPVCFVPAERLLNRLRRWLLLSGQWRRHSKMVAALKAQAALNGGAWPFDETERALLAGEDASAVIGAYLSVRKHKENAAAHTSDPVTRAVMAQYEGWPYPAWTRITVDEKRRLPDVIHKMDPALAKALPVEADMLIAGCGTGRQAASVALHYPDARVTAIDVSEASLDYARRQCADFGIGNVRFVRLDLHDVAELNQRFHAIHCAGVLHHLPNPEQGFKLLADVLHPGGVMHIMVYNRHQRLMIAGARFFLISDLLQEPIDDELLRKVRQRFLEQPGHPAASYAIRSRDFATLAGTHDLLLHRHEEGFDIDRIKHALDYAGLRMLSFDMPTPAIAARYDAMFPDDPKHRDLKSWSRFEQSDPSIAQRHYRFWCCTPSDLR
jgi:2-polyprenyl-3-methyl-5-hydroxy-6-metoxy-1,4-benzoquinol methylase